MSTDGPRYPEYPGEQPHPETSYPPPPPAPQSPQAWPPPGPAGQGATRPDLAGWWMRVGAYLLDALILVVVLIVPLVVGFVVLFAGSTYDEATDTFDGLNPLGWVVIGLTVVLSLGFDIWNRGLRTGYRGQSLGKQVLGLHVVREGGNQPIGSTEGFFRWLVGLLLQWTCVGQALDLLWPLWDGKNQTIHDKTVSTVVVRR